MGHLNYLFLLNYLHYLLKQYLFIEGLGKLCIKQESINLVSLTHI